MPDDETPQSTVMVAPLAESADLADLMNDDGTIKGSPANDADGE